MTILGSVVFAMIFAPLVALAFVVRSRDCWKAKAECWQGKYQHLRGVAIVPLRELASEGDELARLILRQMNEPLPGETQEIN